MFPTDTIKKNERCASRGNHDNRSILRLSWQMRIQVSCLAVIAVDRRGSSNFASRGSRYDSHDSRARGPAPAPARLANAIAHRSQGQVPWRSPDDLGDDRCRRDPFLVIIRAESHRRKTTSAYYREHLCEDRHRRSSARIEDSNNRLLLPTPSSHAHALERSHSLLRQLANRRELSLCRGGNLSITRLSGNWREDRAT